jgi:hypothetical protein
MKTPPQPPPQKQLISPPNPPTALTAAPRHLGKSKLPYIKPTVELLSTPSVTHAGKGNYLYNELLPSQTPGGPS